MSEFDFDFQFRTDREWWLKIPLKVREFIKGNIEQISPNLYHKVEKVMGR